jgi:hypothetical protein
MCFLIWDFRTVKICFSNLDGERDALARGAALDWLIDVCK